MRHFLCAAAALAAFATPAVAETIAITGGRVVVGDGTAPIDGGTVIIRDGNVIAAGASLAVPADARRIDAKGKWVVNDKVVNNGHFLSIREQLQSLPLIDYQEKIISN